MVNRVTDQLFKQPRASTHTPKNFSSSHVRQTHWGVARDLVERYGLQTRGAPFIAMLGPLACHLSEGWFGLSQESPVSLTD